MNPKHVRHLKHYGKTDHSAKLAAQGLRHPRPWESGWFVCVMEEGEPRKVWATDEAAQKETPPPGNPAGA